MKIMFSFLIILFFLTNSIISQDPHYINYTINNGLPSNQIYDIEFDEKGLMWITTDRGVCTFDGNEFNTYTTENGLGDNVNFKIYKDWNDKLWFTGYNGSLSTYEKGSFSSKKLNHPSKHSISWVDEIRQIDTLEYLMTYDLSASITSHLEISHDSFDIKYFEYNKNSRNIKHEKYSIHFYNNRDFNAVRLKSSIDHKVDSATFYFTQNKFVQINKNGDSTSIKTKEYIQEINIPNIDTILISTSSGCKILNGNKIVTVLKDKFVTRSKFDHQKNLWISTLNNGIFKIPNYQLKSYETFNESTKSKFSEIEVLGNYLLISSNQNSVIIIDSLENMTTIPFSTESDFEIELTYNKHFNTIESNATGIFSLKPDSTIKLEHKTQCQKRIRLSNGKYLYRLGSSRGYRISSDDNCINPNREDVNVSLGSPAQHAYESTNGLFITTHNNLYLVKNHEYSAPQIITTSKGQDIPKVTDIIEGNNKAIWLSTLGNGLFHYANDSLQAIPLKNKLIENIHLIGDSIVLTATNAGLGLIKYKYINNKISFEERIYTTEDGLFSNSINDVHFFNDKIWAITGNEIFSADINSLDSRKSEIPLNINRINNVAINNKRKKNNLVYNYNINNVVIEYQGIDFRNNKLDYQYCLSKNNSKIKWTESHDESVNYSNLEFGDYNFLLNVKNKDGFWNTNPKVISFKILPHFSEKNWFKVLSFALLVTIALLILNYFFNRYKKQKTKEIEYQKAITQARDAEISVIRNQMNPHFIFNSLNSIQNLIFKKDVIGANHYLSKFSTLIRKSLEYSRVDYISIEDELNFINNYVELETLRFPNKFNLKYEIDESIDISIGKIPSLMIQPIIENSIKHAFKDLTQKGSILILIKSTDEEYVKITIQDNGPGISLVRNNNDLKHRSLGLKLITERINILKNTYPNTLFQYENVEEQEQNGLKSTLTLPLK